MEENRNVEKELQEDLDFRNKTVSRSIERRRTMGSFQKIKDIVQYLVDLSFLFGMQTLLDAWGGSRFLLEKYKAEKEKFEKNMASMMILSIV